MPALSHIPVLLKELLAVFENNSKEPQKILDCTFGRGGHSLALLKQFPKSSILALDRDLCAVEFAKNQLNQQKQLQVLHQNFHQFPLKTTETFDLILMDLGVSSPQLDEGQRGFSFYKEGPLDMRMDQSQSLTAKQIINSWTKKELLDLFQQYGEIKKPYLVVEQILKMRKKQKMESTTQLASLIKQYSRPSRWNKHPSHPMVFGSKNGCQSRA